MQVEAPMPRRQGRAFYKAGEAVLAYGLTMTRFL